MKTAAILFTYNRPWHTSKVLEGLSRNTVMPDKLYIFHDGKKDITNEDDWNKVEDIIRDVDWCGCEVITSAINKGLADSVVFGINYVFKSYDAVIVLEDDCVPAENFVSFMMQCFEKYKNDEKVFSVSGYSYPIDIQEDEFDIYGCGRSSSWGWGTWGDRWKIFNKDYELIRRIKQEENMSRYLAIWGNDLEDMVVGNVRGTIDSWAVFWALNIISKGGICINPYKSLIKNIGLDGTGVHCGNDKTYEVLLSREGKKIFNLPDKIDFREEVVEAFAPLCGSYTAICQKDISKKNILVYGLGKFFLQNEQKVNIEYNIEAFIDQYKKGWFAGKRIIKMNEIKNYQYDKILIMVKNSQECINIVHKLMDQSIDYTKLIIGIGCYDHYVKCFDDIEIMSNGEIRLLKA